MTSSKNGIQLALGAGIVSSLFSLVFQWPGVVLSPDGWAYWEGSVSLLAGNGYRFLAGPAITGWPPGFSLYLALWQAVLGNSAGTIAVAHAAAIGIASGLWVAASNELNRAREQGLRRLALAVVFALALPIALRSVLSESLFMALFGAAVMVALRRPREAWAAGKGGGGLARAATFSLILSGLLLTRHVGAALVPALAWLYWRSTPGADKRRGLLVVAGTAAAIVAWMAGRALLGQLADHPRIELDRSAVARIAGSTWANLLESWSALAPGSASGLIVSVAAGALLFLLLRAMGWPPATQRLVSAGKSRSGLPFTAALAAACGFFVWALYGVVGSRFVLPLVALLLLTLGEQAERADSPRGRRLAAAVLGCLAAIQLIRGGYWIRYSLRAAPQGVEWSRKLVPACAPGAADCSLAPNEIAPRDFPWIERDCSRVELPVPK